MVFSLETLDRTVEDEQGILSLKEWVQTEKKPTARCFLKAF
jgi:hypothetical protein